MIEIAKQVPNISKVEDWLNSYIRHYLKPDVSSYAKGRLRTWLQKEPTLTSPTRILTGTPVDDRILDRLRDLIGFPFDFCLVTYSGDDTPIGISPHRDASYADFEAYALHVSGECRFDYWQGRKAFGKAPNEREFDPKSEAPTDSLLLSPGDVVHFNCKNVHAASPGVKRWNINFWKAKPNAT